jgi:tetratricopeptide (TPR) repeat protein
VENQFKALQSGLKQGPGAGKSRAALGIVALFLSLALFAGCFRDPNVRKHKYLESGERFSAQGKDREAAIQFSNALKIDKNFADAHYELAKTYLHMGAFSAAYGELLRTVDLQPANYKARLELGNMLLAGGNVDGAQTQADAVLAAEPNNADVHALLSRIAAKRGQKEQALSEIHRALELNPDNAEYHDTLALLEVGEPAQDSQVEDELKKAATLDPKSLNAKLLLSAFYVKNGRLAEAEKVGWEAVATDSKSLVARANVAHVILLEGDQSRAVKVLRQASDDFADNLPGVQILADYYIRSGQIGKAKTEFARLAQAYPKNISLQEAYARFLIQAGDNATAQTLVAGLMKDNGKDPQVSALNGIVLLNNDHPGDAVVALEGAASNAPKDAFIQFWLGRAALAKGDGNLAEKSFRQAAQLNPPGLEALTQLAIIAAQRGDTNMLTDLADKAIAAAPHFYRGYLWRATVELNSHAEDKAEADLKTAMGYAPQDPQAYLMLGEIRFAQKRYPEGAALLEKALACDPNSVPALRGLVTYDLMKKQPAQALDRLNTQIAKSPNNSGFLDLLAQLQIENKNFDQAAVTAQKAIHVNPNDAEAVSIYAQLQVQHGQAGNAISAWQQWSNAHPGNAGAFAVMGTLEESRGNWQQAENDYKKALQIQSAQPVAANNLAYLMLEHGGDVDMALTLAQTARQAAPNSPFSADTLAWAYYYKGAYGFARDLLEDAVKTNPKDAAMQYHLGMVYGKLGNKGDAAAHLKNAISLAPGSTVAKQAQAALQGLG